MEDGILRGGQYRDGPGALRGAVDVVRHAEHGADPVQGVRLAAQAGE